MTLFRTLFREALGLVVDDSSLALAVVAVVALCAILVHLGVEPGPAALLLAAALLVVLVENVWRSARGRKGHAG